MTYLTKPSDIYTELDAKDNIRKLLASNSVSISDFRPVRLDDYWISNNFSIIGPARELDAQVIRQPRFIVTFLVDQIDEFWE